MSASASSSPTKPLANSRMPSWSRSAGSSPHKTTAALLSELAQASDDSSSSDSDSEDDMSGSYSGSAALWSRAPKGARRQAKQHAAVHKALYQDPDPAPETAVVNRHSSFRRKPSYHDTTGSGHMSTYTSASTTASGTGTTGTAGTGSGDGWRGSASGGAAAMLTYSSSTISDDGYGGSATGGMPRRVNSSHKFAVGEVDKVGSSFTDALGMLSQDAAGSSRSVMAAGRPDMPALNLNFSRGSIGATSPTKAGTFSPRLGGSGTGTGTGTGTGNVSPRLAAAASAHLATPRMHMAGSAPPCTFAVSSSSGSNSAAGSTTTAAPSTSSNIASNSSRRPPKLSFRGAAHIVAKAHGMATAHSHSQPGAGAGYGSGSMTARASASSAASASSSYTYTSSSSHQPLSARRSKMASLGQANLNGASTALSLQ